MSYKNIRVFILTGRTEKELEEVLNGYFSRWVSNIFIDLKLSKQDGKYVAVVIYSEETPDE